MNAKYILNDVLIKHHKQYLQAHKLCAQQLKVINALTKCRTSALGEHWEACDTCGVIKVHYNSCGNRHCPSCGGVNTERWLLERSYDLFDVKHFHVTFTVPFELRLLFRFNKEKLFELLMQTVKQTLESFAKDPKSRLQAQLGVIAVLHTWTQQLEFHPHMHCIIPAGGLTHHGEWKKVKGNYLFKVEHLSDVFKNKFCEALEAMYGTLNLPDKLSYLHRSDSYAKFINYLKGKQWVVHSKPSFKGSKQVLEYLARYTHKIAISNHRILKVTDTEITFSYRDRKDGDKQKQKTIPIDTFIHLFLQHVLPFRFVKIRHWGYFATRIKREKLATIKSSLGESTKERTKKLTQQEVLLLTSGIDVTKCSVCNTGKMVVFKTLPPVRGSPRKLPLGKFYEPEKIKL